MHCADKHCGGDEELDVGQGISLMLDKEAVIVISDNTLSDSFARNST